MYLPNGLGNAERVDFSGVVHTRNTESKDAQEVFTETLKIS
jgi:hypothetical protein